MSPSRSDCTWDVILKLRNNIELDSDLQLARLEIEKVVGKPPQAVNQMEFAALAAGALLRPHDCNCCRPNGIAGYRVSADRVDCKALFRRLSFVELVVGVCASRGEQSAEVRQAIAGVPVCFVRACSIQGRALFRLVPFNAVAEWSDVAARKGSTCAESVALLEQTLALTLEGPQTARHQAAVESAVRARRTTGHLFHGLHVYKAKFFPRMVRSLLNIYAPTDNAPVLDPYVGSGTAITEACVLGMPSSGVDIDPLSVLISSAKIELLQTSAYGLIEAVLDAKSRLQTLHTGQLSLWRVREGQAAYDIVPAFLKRRIPDEVQAEVAEDIGLVLSSLNGSGEQASVPLRVALSDAISRKFKFRFLGLGYGRFSLNIMPGRIIDKFSENLDYLANSLAVWQWLRKAGNLVPAPSSVRSGDARSLPFDQETFGLVVTSPPYMPASSGRENYLKSKALAMTALGLLRGDSVDEQERTQIGSVHRSESLDGLPPKAREVVQWMAADEVREVKAPATASYFSDLTQSLREIRRVLYPGGRCAMVVARQHTFYRYKSREIVRMVENAEVVSELATLSGLEVEDAIHIELKKQNTVARPRSLDAYYETVLILRRP